MKKTVKLVKMGEGEYMTEDCRFIIKKLVGSQYTYGYLIDDTVSSEDTVGFYCADNRKKGFGRSLPKVIATIRQRLINLANGETVKPAPVLYNPF